MKKLSAVVLLALSSVSYVAASEKDDLQRAGLHQCIANHQAMTDLIFDIAERDEDVLREYSHYEVADRSIQRWAGTSDAEDEDVQAAIIELTDKKHKSFDNAVGLMYGRQLKTDRLLNLRNSVSACYGMKFDNALIDEVCATDKSGGTAWCNSRF